MRDEQNDDYMMSDKAARRLYVAVAIIVTLVMALDVIRISQRPGKTDQTTMCVLDCRQW